MARGRVVLAGDVGGTHARLALFTGDAAHPKILALEIFASAAYANFREVVRACRERHPQPIDAACFGVAGAIRDGKSKLLNVAWPEIDAAELAADLGLKAVRLANDLEVNAYGIAVLGADDLLTLNPGAPDATGNRVLIAAGTGLGEAGLLAEGDEYKPWACEGGHCDFAPRNAVEIALLEFLLKEFDHVSYERVVSGPGLHNIYRFLRDTARADEPGWLRERIDADDPAAVISELALAGDPAICVEALDLFVAIYGAEAGNLALKGMAAGGVYVGGGIAPKILPKLRAPAFFDAFRAKGRSRPLLESMPLHVILNDQTALAGAARLAMLSL